MTDTKQLCAHSKTDGADFTETPSSTQASTNHPRLRGARQSCNESTHAHELELIFTSSFKLAIQNLKPQPLAILSKTTVSIGFKGCCLIHILPPDSTSRSSYQNRNGTRIVTRDPLRALASSEGQTINDCSSSFCRSFYW